MLFLKNVNKINNIDPLVFLSSLHGNTIKRGYLLVQVMSSEREDECIIVLCYFFSSNLQIEEKLDEESKVYLKKPSKLFLTVFPLGS